MFKKNENKNICVVGVGRYGRAIIEQLYKLKKQVIAVDKEEATLRGIKEFVVDSYVADAADPEVLKTIGLDNMETFIVALSENIEIIASLLELNVKNIIARASTRSHARVLKQIGVDVIILPEEEAGVRTALLAAHKSFIKFTETFQELGDGYVVGSVVLNNTKFDKLSLKNLNFAKYNVIIVMVKRQNQSFLPDGNFILNQNDLITIIGKVQNVTQVFELVSQQI
ncbi:potassium channel family protein [Mesomycoplasma neurolyticum]|uniref:Potassium uptake protein A n=1 Tax=Mesomycoplasma neurolyticum TaxID=2120 RepID=A0A449A5D8_9BACT|nr:TrkA family potassium uptake protein [Mesomycoplasma neurolyticum]VEU59442.1 potassium uptake protein A [Mesomycoplasma neurolyticum]